MKDTLSKHRLNGCQSAAAETLRRNSIDWVREMDNEKGELELMAQVRPDAFSIEFDVAMVPVGKGRPRFTRTGHAYTPAKTRNAETLIATAARAAMNGRTPVEAPVSVFVMAYFPIPKSWPKEKRERAACHLISPQVKPDADNCLKLVLDAMNGIVFKDDKQVFCVSFTKHYSAAPRLKILVAD